MNGYEQLVPYLIAERHQRADAERLAKAAKNSQPVIDETEADEGPRPSYLGEPWIPALRGYPYDPEFGR